ncbi:phosphate ABC transporter ATP-binding protein [Allorhodopirellula heiligendammensis]|uniref:Phosphate import ATP-binding protein PstB 3 n=1 Tax=Allorhodopirellula heiligendammensis TaxID=2714739 RepID=A0A5C6CAV4_9BACT|nr:phosphate ABC transporter ATP-binding protein [Allorhodopirellula heiligendammensis]TWU19939.1 Phosphate import ATP-binding protein PstB 3 [Allorhodopirellula heiligendammensis]
MISTDDLSIEYNGRTILRRATIAAEPGRVLALVGPSGCGKSSLLAALNQMTEIIPGASVCGTIKFNGQDIRDVFETSVHLRRHVGMIFQKPNPFPMSIRRNIELALHQHGKHSKPAINEITETVLRDVGLWEEVHSRLDRPALDLSGGQQQRLCIARALALQPQVLLMDEPCSALDPISAERVEQLIESMRGKYSVIIVTHNLAQARRIADHVAVFWMQDGVGEIIEQGETDAIFDASTNALVNAYLSGRKG